MKQGVLALLCATMAWTPRAGWAPCILFPPPDQWVASVGQQAIYVIHKGNGARYRVALIPRVQFRGSPSEFGILVPTPAPPKFDTVGGTAFDEAAMVTRPIWRTRSMWEGGCGMFGRHAVDFEEGPVPLDAREEGVTVLSQQTVGAFDVTVLSATDPTALIRWLDTHGYRHGVEDERVLEEYIAQKWVFTAMRMDGKQLAKGVQLAQTEPVALLYETDVLVYPLRLAALSASRSESTLVQLYVVAQERTDFEGARTRYANRLSSAELDRIREDAPAFGSLLTKGDFLTKLQRDYSIFEMKEDFALKPTASREFQEIRYSSSFALGDYLWLGIPIGWLAAGRLRRMAGRKGKRPSLLGGNDP